VNYFDYILYILVPYVLIAIFYLAKLLINRYFDYKIKQASNPNQSLFFPASLLLIAFITLIAFNPLEFFAKLLGFEKVPTTLNLYSLIAFIVLVVGIVVLFIKNRTRLQEEMDRREKEEQRVLKIDFPKEIELESPIFYKRVEELFLLKFEELKELTYDKEEKILYGEYRSGYRRYFLLIYCDDSIDDKTILAKEQIEIYKKLEKTKEILFDIEQNDIVEFFYLLENGSFEKNSISLITKSENEFLNELINFESYLKKLIKNYNRDKLFSAIAKDEDKYTLAQTFISPYFNDGKVELDNYIDKWLREDSLKHLGILGDYGMGKSSFMKYYASKLAKEILDSGNIKRFPIFLSLTNISPMHNGLKDKIGSFVSNQLGIRYEVFQKLIDRGKILFILDGFDEMGFIGTHQQRFKQFNAIWQLATKNNKILISGRPSYFPTKFELKSILNVADKSEEFTKNTPFYEILNLDRFNKSQIEKSISIYYPDERGKYFDFISKNETLLNLSTRPSMMHIVREMLPTLYNSFDTKELTAGKLMEQYIDYWIERQESKEIVSSFKDKKQKKEFIVSFFTDLAVELYLSDNLKIESKEIISKLENELKSLNILEASEREGVESEILTGYFIKIDSSDDSEGFKFVHKSFFEYFVSLKIVELIKERDFKHKLMQTDWSFEIVDFIYDEIDDKYKNSGIPSLLYLADGKVLGKLKFKLFNISVSLLSLVSFSFSLSLLASLLILVSYSLALLGLALVTVLVAVLALAKSSRFILKAINISYLKKEQLNLNNKALIQLIKTNTVQKIDNIEFTKELFKFIEIRNIELKKNLFSRCKFENVNFQNIKVEKNLLNKNEKTFTIAFFNMTPKDIDLYTVNSLKKLIEKENLIVGEDIIGDEWLMEELKKPIEEI